MSISVTGKHIEVGESLSETAVQSLEIVVEKYMGEIIGAEIVFSKDHSQFECKINVHISNGLNIHLGAQAADPYQSLTQALHKLENRIKRYKNRLTHHRRVSKEEILESIAQKYVLKSEEEDNGKEESPIIIAEMDKKIYTLSVKEAVMRMDLTDSAFLLFKSAANGKFSLVYKRKDGNIGWIETQ